MKTKPAPPESAKTATATGQFRDKRKHKRFIITLPATITTDGRTFECLISNVSEEGMASLLTTSIRTDEDFHPHSTAKLSMELPNGTTVNLDCDVRWFLRTPANKGSLMLGLFIPEPPDAYQEWIGKFI